MHLVHPVLICSILPTKVSVLPLRYLIQRRPLMMKYWEDGIVFFQAVLRFLVPHRYDLDFDVDLDPGPDLDPDPGLDSDPGLELSTRA